MSVIYHCPFCGGAAPKSKRHLLFAIIPTEEEARPAKLLARVRTIRGAIERLGKPEKDEPAGTQVRTHEADGQPPTTEHRHTLTYNKVSEVADVVITEPANGRIHWQLMGKYIGAPASSGNATGCIASHAERAGQFPPDRVEDDPALSIEKPCDS